MIKPYFLSLGKPEGVLKAFFWLTFGEKDVLKNLSASEVILMLHSVPKRGQTWLSVCFTKKHPKSADCIFFKRARLGYSCAKFHACNKSQFSVQLWPFFNSKGIYYVIFN